LLHSEACYVHVFPKQARNFINFDGQEGKVDSHKNRIHDFWNQRAKCGDNAGTNDFMLKYLEEKVLLERIPRGAKVLDIGCGNGSTLIHLAKEKECSGVGIDYANDLVKLAEQAAIEQNLQHKLKFFNRDVMTLGNDLGKFQYIITQRCLINLDILEEQKRAFEAILQLLSHGGFYYMIESFNDGNRALNILREGFQLEPMEAPWHNLFFELEKVLGWQKDNPAIVEEVSHFASTYYFLSRVIYAKLSADRNEPLRYDSDINRISLHLPPIGDFGATKLIVWRKK
jgi:ubiquinone/menaquinone biosynthesis C-methylase UbiE